MTFTEDVFSQLSSFVNKNSLENGCNLPDFVIARHLEAAYFSLCKTMQDMATHFNVPAGWSGAPAWSENLKDPDWLDQVTPHAENWEDLAEDSALTHMTETEDTDAEALLGEVTIVSVNHTDLYAATVVDGILNIGGKATAEQIANADCSGSCSNGIEDDDEEDTYIPGRGFWSNA